MIYRSGQKRFWNQTRLLFLYFSFCIMFWPDKKAVLTIVDFRLADIFYSKFQLISTLFNWSEFCVQYSLPFCDPRCKWVTYHSWCRVLETSSSYIEVLFSSCIEVALFNLLLLTKQPNLETSLPFSLSKQTSLEYFTEFFASIPFHGGLTVRFTIADKIT